MTYKVPSIDPDAPAIVIDVGNSTIEVATWHDGEVKTPLNAATSDQQAFAQNFGAHFEALPGRKLGAVAVSSVVPEALARVRLHVEATTDRTAFVIGENLPLPLDVAVADARAVGVDRICAAAAVFDKIKRSCVIVGFGTAVTVDLVADDGTFLGGAILPGLRMQVRSLHENTALLPEAPVELPESAYGRDTIEAIQTGVCRGLAGAVRGIVEGYATWLGFWPQVVATGGDLPMMGPLCDFIDTQVQHLVLRGVGVAYSRYLTERART